MGLRVVKNRNNIAKHASEFISFKTQISGIVKIEHMANFIAVLVKWSMIKYHQPQKQTGHSECTSSQKKTSKLLIFINPSSMLRTINNA